MHNPNIAVAASLSEPANLRVHLRPSSMEDDLALVQRLLSAPQAQLHPRFLYDSRGSALFEEITQSPDYYPTRTEAEIFEQYSGEMLDSIGAYQVLMEPGGADCGKARWLFRDTLSHYVPIEISADYLVDCCRDLAREFPELSVEAVCGDFTRCRSLPEPIPGGGRLVFFPGSTIGNFDPADAARLLENFRELARPGGYLLIGTDLPKEREILERAYDDREGLTARFNLNMLEHLNRRLDCDFEAGDFRHKALFNEELSRVEMHLVARRRTVVRAGDQRRELVPGESIHTENSYKYTPAAFARIARASGLAPVKTWTDQRQWFAVHLFRVS